MDDSDRFRQTALSRPVLQRGEDERGIHIPRRAVAVDEDGTRTQIDRGVHRGAESQGGSKNLVSRAHADELETSLYLHLAPERVRMDLAVADNDRMGRFVSSDSTGNYPVRFNDYWGRWTRTGVHGDATKATAEKGRILFEAAVTGLVQLVDELRAWPIETRVEMHESPVQSEIRW